MVLWNDGRGGLSSQRATTVALPGAGRVRALAAGRLDPRRLYAASQQGVFFLSGSKEDPRRLSARKLEDVDGGVALAVGDVDGDRLDDLAVGGPEGIRIQQAEEVQR
ncbi:MAG: hypothetical protein FJ125_12905 [Deltaproteobacteria bacterium]|nr:hypothetical protein [Deltaproteobacteria bacterium]